VLIALTDDVAWANGMDGGHVHGREAVREYWTRQWTMVSPHVEPVGFHRTADGAIIAEVRQSVRDLEGKPLQGRRTGLKTRRSDTFSVFERARGLASTSRMLHRAPRLVQSQNATAVRRSSTRLAPGWSSADAARSQPTPYPTTRTAPTSTRLLDMLVLTKNLCFRSLNAIGEIA
jgi:hypothetical protein